MELRTLEYFLAIAREQNITRAADSLHITQPSLSRQLKELEEELGKQLVIRGKRKVTLTEDGMLLRKRAEELIQLAHKTEKELKNSSNTLSGDIYIGAGESDSIRNIIRMAGQFQQENPDVHFHFISGDSADLLERLDSGILDLCIIFGDMDQSKYNYIRLPFSEKWGVLMRSDSELAKKKKIDTKALWKLPLIFSRQALQNTQFIKWLGKPVSELNIINTYNLIYNATLMAEEGLGYVLTLDKLVNTKGTNLTFKLLSPAQELPISIAWKKYQPQTKTASEFIDVLMDAFMTISQTRT